MTGRLLFEAAGMTRTLHAILVLDTCISTALTVVDRQLGALSVVKLSVHYRADPHLERWLQAYSLPNRSRFYALSLAAMAERTGIDQQAPAAVVLPVASTSTHSRKEPT